MSEMLSGNSQIIYNFNTLFILSSGGIGSIEWSRWVEVVDIITIVYKYTLTPLITYPKGYRINRTPPRGISTSKFQRSRTPYPIFIHQDSKKGLEEGEVFHT